ncbi:hypothetical protein EBN88_28760 [Streptomyces triticirhizae]|uniref:Uncharacterized protein n=1 Tax=Streptomyces triticirhizae TaxID=2483353 RepID=A0A3M2KQH1_9ACTN|nr:hypothetical protein EBN88_28760 [Streptomyces triticirhizae]
MILPVPTHCPESPRRRLIGSLKASERAGPSGRQLARTVTEVPGPPEAGEMVSGATLSQAGLASSSTARPSWGTASEISVTSSAVTWAGSCSCAMAGPDRPRERATVTAASASGLVGGA